MTHTLLGKKFIVDASIGDLKKTRRRLLSIGDLKKTRRRLLLIGDLLDASIGDRAVSLGIPLDHQFITKS